MGKSVAGVGALRTHVTASDLRAHAGGPDIPKGAGKVSRQPCQCGVAAGVSHRARDALWL